MDWSVRSSESPFGASVGSSLVLRQFSSPPFCELWRIGLSVRGSGASVRWIRRSVREIGWLPAVVLLPGGIIEHCDRDSSMWNAQRCSKELRFAATELVLTCSCSQGRCDASIQGISCET